MKSIDRPTERVAGRVAYMECLGTLHRILKPRLYFEIGVRHGKSLSLALAEAIGVDPDYSVTYQLSAPTRIYKMTSDDFFASDAREILTTPIDLAFIDGRHLFEFALRDFINIERFSHPFTALVFDDIYPNHPMQAQRDRQTSMWTGDVWKIVPCLRRFRPDLTLVQLDTSPTGLLLVLGLSPSNTVLSDRYAEIVQKFNGDDALLPPQEVLTRTAAADPADPAVFQVLEQLRSAREGGAITNAQDAILRCGL